MGRIVSMRIGDGTLDNVDLAIRANGAIKTTDNGSSLNHRIATNRLLDLDWGLPKAIITDRGLQFLAELWHTIWTKLGTQLLYSTAYHLQTDSQSERLG